MLTKLHKFVFVQCHVLTSHLILSLLSMFACLNCESNSCVDALTKIWSFDLKEYRTLGMFYEVFILDSTYYLLTVCA